MARQYWYFVESQYGGCRYYRQVLPLRHLYHRRLQKMGVRVKLGSNLGEAMNADAIFFSRNIGAKNLAVVKLLASLGKFIVWDMDDDLFIPERWLQYEHDPAWVKLEILAMSQCLGIANLVVASTDALARRIGLPETTVVCQNAIDTQYDWVCPKEPLQGRRRILYAGTSTHAQDLVLIKRLYQKTRSNIDWFFFGCHPAWAGNDAIKIPLTSIHDYPRMCQFINPHVSLAPLLPCQFNESKSPIKVWEMETLRGAVVASNTGPYRGHPAAVVPEGAEFQEEHLRVDHASAEKSFINAIENSWGRYRSPESAWGSMFDSVFNGVADIKGSKLNCVAACGA